MEAFWTDSSSRKQKGLLNKHEEKLFKKLVKALGFLSANPRTTAWPLMKLTT